MSIVIENQGKGIIMVNGKALPSTTKLLLGDVMSGRLTEDEHDAALDCYEGGKLDIGWKPTIQMPLVSATENSEENLMVSFYQKGKNGTRHTPTTVPFYVWEWFYSAEMVKAFEEFKARHVDGREPAPWARKAYNGEPAKNGTVMFPTRKRMEEMRLERREEKAEERKEAKAADATRLAEAEAQIAAFRAKQANAAGPVTNAVPEPIKHPATALLS